mmetsp:Transcript_14861/g.46792  ORF Transcript_14861/g.46792 Transcript_14861/m.46792 type:complete len:218 (-) Transcript_14861:7-660(-)
MCHRVATQVGLSRICRALTRARWTVGLASLWIRFRSALLSNTSVRRTRSRRLCTRPRPHPSQRSSRNSSATATWRRFITLLLHSTRPCRPTRAPARLTSSSTLTVRPSAVAPTWPWTPLTLRCAPRPGMWPLVLTRTASTTLHAPSTSCVFSTTRRLPATRLTCCARLSAPPSARSPSQASAAAACAPALPTSPLALSALPEKCPAFAFEKFASTAF